MFAISWVLLTLAIETPKEALEVSLKHYQSLTSFSAIIESHDASGLFPGNFVQSLKWMKGNRFELVTLKNTDFVSSSANPGSEVPEFFSNGKEVMTRRPDGTKTSRSLDPGPNVVPGWEVAGGLVFGWLLDSPGSKLLINPPEGFRVEYSFGQKKQWEASSVREILLNITNSGRSQQVSLFLEAEGKHVIGYEYSEGGKRKWQKLREIKDNPKLPEKLGDHW